MKNADEMTPEELRTLANKKEEDERWEPIKTARLRHDLYSFSGDSLAIGANNMDWLITKAELDQFIDYYLSLIVDLEAGTLFECYGKNQWFDTVGFGAEEMSDEWAEEHLTDIVDLK